MSKEKPILQLRTKGYSQRKIAYTLEVSRNTVAKVFKALQKHPVYENSLNTLNDLIILFLPAALHSALGTSSPTTLLFCYTFPCYIPCR